MAQNAVIAAFLMSLAGGGQVGASLCGKQIGAVANLIHELTGVHGGKVVFADPQLISIADEANHRVWSIGKLADSTPVIVCREVVKADGVYRVNVRALCRGPKEECDAFISEFRT